MYAVYVTQNKTYITDMISRALVIYMMRASVVFISISGQNPDQDSINVAKDAGMIIPMRGSVIRLVSMK